MARAVDVPRDGAVRGAQLVVAGRAGGGARVAGDLGAAGALDDHAAHEVGVVVVLVVDDGEGLRLDADLRVGGHELDVAGGGGVNGSRGLLVQGAEDTVVEGGLVLVGGAAGAELGVGPVDLVGLADLHVDAVLPVVRRRELGVVGVVVVAAAAAAHLCLGEKLAARVGGAGTVLVELALGPVLGAKVPVHVDGAEASLEVRRADRRNAVGVVAALGEGAIAVHGDVTTRLLDEGGDAVDVAGHVVPAGGGLGALADVGAGEGGLGGVSGHPDVQAGGLRGGDVLDVSLDRRDHAEGGEGRGAADGDAGAERDGGLGRDGGGGLDLRINFDNGGHGGGGCAGRSDVGHFDIWLVTKTVNACHRSRFLEGFRGQPNRKIEGAGGSRPERGLMIGQNVSATLSFWIM